MEGYLVIMIYKWQGMWLKIGIDVNVALVGDFLEFL